jgi:hypothetical protein
MIEPDINEQMARFAPSQNPADPGFDAIEKAVAGMSGVPMPKPEPVDMDIDRAVQDIAAQRRQDMASSLMAASEVNPDEAAQADALGRRFGVGQDIALRNMSEMRRQAMIQDTERMDLLRKDPVLARYIADREFAAQASDDVGVLSMLRPMVLEAATLQTPGGFFRVVGRGYERGQIVSERGDIGAKAMAGFAEQGDFDRAKQLQDRMQQLGQQGLLGAAAEMIAQNVSQLRTIGTTAAGGAALGSIAGPVGTVTGGTLGAAAGIVIGTGTMEAGNLYLDMRDQGVSDDAAIPAAIAGGFLNGVIEVVGMKIASAPFKALASKVIREEVSRAIAQPTMRSALIAAGKAYGLQVGGEAAEEGLQEIVAIASEEIAKAADGIDSETSLREATGRVIEAFAYGGMASALLGGIGPGANLVVDLRRANATQRQQAFFDGLVENRKESKLAQRNPQGYERFLAAQAQDTPAETIYVDAATARDILAQSGTTTAQLEDILPGIRERLEKAVETGGDVTIPTSQFGARLANTELGNALLPHMRLSPEAMSATEAQAFEAQRQAVVEEARTILATKQEADAAFVAEAQQVEDEAFEQVRAVGQFTDIEARTIAKLRQAMVVVDAAEAGMTPAQYQRERGVPLQVRGVQGEIAPVAPLEQAARSQLQARARQLGIPATTSNSAMQRDIDILTRDPKTWSREDFDAVKDFLAIHQDVRPGAAERSESIMREGLRGGMVDSIAAMDEGRRTWAGELIGGEAYVFPYRTLRFMSKDDPHLAVGNIPLFKITPKRGQNLYEAIKESAVLNPAGIPVSPSAPLEQAAKLDADYLAAVERGDMATAQRMVDEAADAAGYTVAGFHGLSEGKLEGDSFDPKRLGNFTGAPSARLGFFFSKSIGTAETYGMPRLRPDVVEIIASRLQRAYEPLINAIPEGVQTVGLAQELSYGENAFNPYMQEGAETDRISAENYLPNLEGLSEAILNDVLEMEDDPEVSKRTFQKLLRLEKQANAEVQKVVTEYTNSGEHLDISTVSVRLRMQNPLVYDQEGAAYRDESYYDIIRRAKQQGHDGVIIKNTYDGGPLDDIYVVFEPEQIKKADPVTRDEAGNIVPLSRRFDITSPKLFEQAAAVSAGANAPGVGVAEENKMGFWPRLRVKITPNAALPVKPLILTGTTNKNAAKQLENIDGILQQFPDAGQSPEAWAQMLAYAFGSDDVPVPPYAFIRDTNGDGSFERLSTLTEGQIADATHGFDNAREFRRAYTNNELDVVTTGKLFLWSFLSRGVSPYTQESLFIDAFNGADEWIRKAAQGQFTENDLEAYENWAKSVAPKGSGQPGAGATHNLNAFGQNFLLKMGAIGPDGRSNLQRLHDMMCDPNQTGKQIRREFATFGEGVGIDNKVVSFTLLVAGFNDVMVLDRVQVRQLWDDGRFSDTNLYDGVTDENNKKIAGSSLNAITEGARGILIYEAIERQLASKIDAMYTRLGRPQDASIGRYHWETWVAYSQQEAAHATLDAILLDAKGDDQAISKVSGKQGEYGAYEYGTQYNRDKDGNPWFRYTTPLGGTYDFSVPVFRQFLTEIKKSANKVVPTNFKVTESGNAPWYTRPEVNQQRLEEQAAKWADRGGGTGEGKRLADEAAANADAIRARSAAGEQPAGRAGILEQAAAGPARGGFDPRTLNVLVGKGGDVSTLAHELIHLRVAEYLRMARGTTPPARVNADLETLFDFMGVEGATFQERLDNYETMTIDQRRPLEEKVTYNFEIYLYEGKAPSVELRGVFDRLAAWMRRVYKSIRDDLNAIYRREFGTDLPILTPEVRSVFDRMLASEEQIKRQEAIEGMKGLFQTQAESGMGDAEWAAYQAMQQEATEAAVTDLNTASMRQVQWLGNARARILRDLQKKHDAKRKEVTAEVAAAVKVEPVYRAMTYLRYGRFVDTDGAEVEVEGTHRLDIEKVRAMYASLPSAEGVELIRATGMAVPANVRPDITPLGTGKYGMLGRDGLDPDVVAEMFGYGSGDEMVRALLAAKPMKDAVAERTDAEMLRRYGDMNTPAALEAEVQKALHNEARARFVAVELRHIAKATQPVRVMLETAKQVASDMISDTTIRDLRPGEFVAAEARAARDAERIQRTYGITEPAPELAQRYGTDRQQALIRAKRAQLYQNQLAAEALRVKEYVDKQVKYLRGVMRDSNVKRMGAAAADQVAGLLERFEVAPVSLKLLDERRSMAKYLVDLKDAGVEPDIADEITNEARRVNYKELKVSEFRDLVDAVRQIEHIGKNEQKMRLAEERAAFEEVRDDVVTRIRAVGKVRGLQIEPRSPLTGIGRSVAFLRGFAAQHLKAASIARILDGGKEDGPLWNAIIRTANDASDMETRMRAEAALKLGEILKPVFALGSMGGKGMYFPSIGRSLNREARIAIALNLGNDGNRQRLLDGEGWTLEQLQPVLESLTEAEWLAVQKVWDFIDGYRPEIAAKERRLYGKEPEWVKPTPFTVRTSDGKEVALQGGYYPVKYDPVASDRVATVDAVEEAKRELKGAYTAATTRRSFVKARAKEVHDKPILYTLDAAFNGVNDVIHDLAWHEWLISTNRLLNDSKFANAVRETRGWEFLKQLRDWSKDNATGARGQQVAGESVLSWLRQGISASGLGFNVVSAAMQITGFNQSIVRVGAKYIGQGIVQFSTSPFESAKTVAEKSSFMAERGRTQFREINEIKNRVRGQTEVARRVTAGTYFLMMNMQRSVDIPTWLGAYQKALDAGKDDAKAVALADQAVRDSQGSGLVSDLAAMERGGPAMKLFTVFYSYMNTVYNMTAVQTMTARGKGKLAADYAMLLVVPVVLGYAIKSVIQPDAGDDELDPEALARKLAAEELSYLMGTMVIAREFGGAAQLLTGAEGVRMGYGGPAGLRAVGEVYGLATQAGQLEFDRAFRRAAINTLGAFTGLPSAQINRTIDGIEALVEGEVEGPSAVLAPLTGVQR